MPRETVAGVGPVVAVGEADRRAEIGEAEPRVGLEVEVGRGEVDAQAAAVGGRDRLQRADRRAAARGDRDRELVTLDDDWSRSSGWSRSPGSACRGCSTCRGSPSPSSTGCSLRCRRGRDRAAACTSRACRWRHRERDDGARRSRTEAGRQVLRARACDIALGIEPAVAHPVAPQVGAVGGVVRGARGRVLDRDRQLRGLAAVIALGA